MRARRFEKNLQSSVVQGPRKYVERIEQRFAARDDDRTGRAGQRTVDDHLHVDGRVAAGIPRIFGVAPATAHVASAQTDEIGGFARVEAFAAELETILRGKGVPVTVNRLASMYTVFFSDGPLRNFEDVKNSDTEMYSRFFRAMRERNIFVAPSAFEVAMVSFAHTEEDFAKTLDAVRGIKL